jgi:glycosyltransferase involved in cell wall biosynthesis
MTTMWQQPRHGPDLGIDSVYFLMYVDWKQELQSNRWHYGIRWARHAPVVLVQPAQITPLSPNPAEPEGRIPNCVILPIRATGEKTYAADLLIQTGQVYDHMRQAGHRRPLLWLYNPRLAGLYAALPSPARVYHATENYFHFTGLSDFFFRELRTAIAISDVVVAVSDGVASSIRNETNRDDVAVVTNGCDRAFYLGDRVNETLAGFRQAFERIAVYAGNINSRIDFDLVVAAAKANPATLLAFYGPVASLNAPDAEAWRLLLRHENVEHFGAVPATRLPEIYRAADLGFIPYKQERVLVENGFPLKALEMGATSLPVVTTHMKPLIGLAQAVVVARDSGEFVEAFASLDRGRVSDDERAELDAVCKANDYDVKFDLVRTLVGDAIRLGPKRLPTRVDEAVAALGEAPWLEACRSNWLRVAVAPRPSASTSTARRHTLASILRAPFAQSYGALGERLPEDVRLRIPKRLRDVLRRIAVG